MAFGKNVKYGSVTLDFILECAKFLGKDPQKKETLREILHLIGFEVSVWNEETKKFIPRKIDQMKNVSVRCANEPYKFRKTTIYSGRLQDKRKCPAAGIYENVDVLDVGISNGAGLVSDMAYDIPSVDKVNTRKYTKKEDRSDVVVMDLPEVEDTDAIFNILKGE